MNTTVQTAIQYWPRVAPLLRPPRTRADYHRLLAALDAVIDAGGADEKNSLAQLADYLGELVADFEAVRIPKREMPVAEFLRELMRQHGLTQSDLPEIGAQSVVSAVLNGKRKLNVRQIAALARRFQLPADTLLP